MCSEQAGHEYLNEQTTNEKPSGGLQSNRYVLILQHFHGNTATEPGATLVSQVSCVDTWEYYAAFQAGLTPQPVNPHSYSAYKPTHFTTLREKVCVGASFGSRSG